MRIISADSAAAILDEKFNPVELIASVAVLVESPYREASVQLAEPIFKKVDESFEVIVNEAQLCQVLLEKVRADVVHLDSTLGGISVEELSPVELANMKISSKARGNLLKILPKLRKVAGEIRRKHSIEMLAIGKESMPVRIAELTAGAEAVIFACQQAVENKEILTLGLPIKCQQRMTGTRIYLYSLMDAEHDVRGYAEDRTNVLRQVSLSEGLNPVARGFRTLTITPKP